MPTVLLIDDCLELIEALGEHLERHNFVVHLAETLAEARLKLAGNPQLDCIVSDHQLEHGTGLQFVRELRSQGNSIPFILMSGSLMLTSAQCEAAGVAKLMAKPFSFEEFERQLLLIVSGSR